LGEPRKARLARQRELRKLHPQLLAHGVPLKGTEQLGQSMALLFRDCLENRQNRLRVLKAAELAHQLYDRGERATAPPRPLACGAGCDFCCHAFVSVLAPEAFLLAERIRQPKEHSRPPAEAVFKSRALASRGLDQVERLKGERRGCALLEERLCSLHPDRPLSCRKHSSFSASACAAAFGGEAVPIPAYDGYHTLGTTVSVTFRGALRSLGYSTALYELGEAVSTILDTENALARWTAGEDILASVQKDTTTPAHLTAAIASLAAAIS
jgi:Fe-S-cluster containining protein